MTVDMIRLQNELKEKFDKLEIKLIELQKENKEIKEDLILLYNKDKKLFN